MMQNEVIIDIENPQKSNNLISRKEVLNYIHKILNQGTGKKKSFEFIQKYVTNMPSVNLQEPCEVEAAKLQQAYDKGFEDCRQAMLNTISELNAISFYEAQEDSKECYYEIRQAVKNIPPIKPQERTGHWNLFHTTEHGMREDSYFKCDRCNYESYKEYNFCTSCGAKMIDSQESEE